MKVSDLKFNAHPAGLGGERAVHMFDNGYGVSVITGGMWLTREGEPYELAVIDVNGITYEAPITDDVLGNLSESEVNKVMRGVEELPEAANV